MHLDIQHLNIPEQRNRRPERKAGLYPFWNDIKWELKGFWSNLKWMLVTVIALKVILGKAVSDLFTVRSLLREIEDHKRRGDIEEDARLSISHGLFALMDGFRVAEELPAPSDKNKVSATATAQEEIEPATPGRRDTEDLQDQLSNQNAGFGRHEEMAEHHNSGNS